jgi:hypothetical protein
MRKLVAVCLGVSAGIFGFTAGLGVTGSWIVAALAALAAAVLTAVWAWRRPPVALEEGAVSRGLKVLSGLATAAALVQLFRLAVFTVAPAEAGYSFLPSSEWELRHSCLSAYYVAAEAASSGANFYDPALYNRPDDVGAQHLLAARLADRSPVAGADQRRAAGAHLRPHRARPASRRGFPRARCGSSGEGVPRPRLTAAARRAVRRRFSGTSARAGKPPPARPPGRRSGCRSWPPSGAPARRGTRGRPRTGTW